MLFNLTLVDRSGKATARLPTVAADIAGTGVVTGRGRSGGVLLGIGGRGV